MTRTDTIARIDAHLREVSALRNRATADKGLAQRIGCVKRWQSERLAHTYTDLLEAPRYAKAARFFLSDLYGAQDFAERDAGLARIVPAVERLLPEHALEAFASAIELHALSERLDHSLAERVTCTPSDEGRLTDHAAVYARAYADEARRPERERQIELIGLTGHAMERLVRIPLVHAALRMMRGPARAAGLAALQAFLERGYDAFAAMNGAGDFLACIDARERDLMNRLFRREPDPFGINAAGATLPD